MKHRILVLVALHLGLTALVAQPVITNPPQNQIAVAGSTANFTVGATGTPPLSYQWRRHINSFNIGLIPDATNATLVLTNVQPTSHRFSVVVTDGASQAVASTPVVQLTVVALPTINPANQTVGLFADVTFIATNNSSIAPLSSQWLFNGEPIPAAVMNRLVVTSVQKTNAGHYAFVANYTFGSATSQVATLRIIPFNSMYWFGFSWTATFIPDHIAPRYYQYHACNGPMWPEFLSTNFALPYAETNNYAIGGAGPNQTLLQVNSFPVPAKPQLSLYFYWFNTEAYPWVIDYTWDEAVPLLITNPSNIVRTLYTRGARQIVLHNYFDLAKFPVVLPRRFPFVDMFGTNAAAFETFGRFVDRLNASLREVIRVFSKERPDVRIIWIDFLTKFNDVIANPQQYGFTTSTIPAINDPVLLNQGPVSFTGPGADYVFWDDVHGTTKLHQLITAWTMDAITNSVLETLEPRIVGGSLQIQMNHLLIGRDYRLQASADLNAWRDVRTFTASAGTNRVTEITSERNLFYRLQWQP